VSLIARGGSNREGGMKYPVILVLSVLIAACDGGQKPTQAPDAMEMPVETPVAAAPVLAAAIGDITIVDAWAPVTPAGGRVAAGYFTIKNSGAADDKLVSAESPRAKSVELHEMVDKNGMMSMRRVSELVLKAGQEVTLKPGNLHLMLIDPALPYIEGETLPVTLTFEHAGKVEVPFLVRPRDAGGASEHGAH
jgi:periplasmic copper chaperone A